MRTKREFTRLTVSRPEDNNRPVEQTNVSVTETSETTETAAAEDLQPQNGIPLLIIRIDESDSAVADLLSSLPSLTEP